MTAPTGYDPKAYPPFAVAVDIVVFTIEDGALQVALIERGEEPHKGSLALPGGFVRPDEDLIDAAVRELEEETGLLAPHLEQLGAYGHPDRDPRMRVVTVAHWAIVAHLPSPIAGTDAAAARLVPVAEVLADPTRLRFDHHTILSDALDQAHDALENTTVATEFCDTEFTIAELRMVYEAVWGIMLDPGNFQNKVTGVEGFLIPTGHRQEGARGRPPELFRAGPAEVIDPPFRRPAGKRNEVPTMNFQGYIERVEFHFKRLGIKERPTEQEYVDAWNSQIPARKLAERFARRDRSKRTS